MIKRLAVVLLLLCLSIEAKAAEYALVNQADEILELRDFASVPNDPVGKNWRWLPVEVTDPAFDGETQVRSGPVTAVEATRVTRVWTVRAKTAPELDADKQAEIDSLPEPVVKALLDHENRVRNSMGQAAITETALRATLKSYIGTTPPAPNAADVAVLRGTGAPAAIFRFTASITIGALTAATSTDKTFSIPGLLTTDTILSVTFTAGLTPATISYTPLRVSAADTLAIRFNKISTGAVTPPAPQAITVLVAR